MCLSMVAAGLAFLMIGGVTNPALIGSFPKAVLLISAVIFIIGFAFSWGPCVWLLCSEIFPIEGREVGMTITTMVNWIFAGLGNGGVNFDAKLRRGSCDELDLFYGHIGGMDTFAKGLEIASKIIEDKVLDNFVADRYSSFNSGIGQEIMNGNCSLEKCEKFILENGEPTLKSGRQEYLENIINDYILNS